MSNVVQVARVKGTDPWIAGLGDGVLTRLSKSTSTLAFGYSLI